MWWIVEWVVDIWMLDVAPDAGGFLGMLDVAPGWIQGVVVRGCWMWPLVNGSTREFLGMLDVAPGE